MTSRSWGFIFLKLFGLYCVMEAALGVVQVASHVLAPPIEGMPSPKMLAALSLAWVVVMAVFAALCLYLTDPLADWLFGEGEPDDETTRPVDIVRAGLVLMGVYLMAVHVISVVWVLGEAFWMLEGSRRASFRGYLGQTWRDFALDAGRFVVGVLLCVRNQQIAFAVWKLPREHVKTATD